MAGKTVGRYKLEDDVNLQTQMAAFAYAYCYLMAKKGKKVGIKQEAAKAVGIKVRTAEDWIAHPIFKEHCKKHIENALKKFDKTPDDVLAEIAAEAFNKIPMDSQTHSDKIKALRLLAQHYKLVDGSESGTQKPTVMLVLPDNSGQKQINGAVDAEFSEVEEDENCPK